MADLFVSYARADRARVAPLVAALEAEGWSVWWDPEIVPGQEFDRLIAEELVKARAVIVVWSPTSVESRWVRGEAREGAERGVLAPVRFEKAHLPIDLRSMHATDLDDWHENRNGPEFRELVRALRVLAPERSGPLHPDDQAPAQHPGVPTIDSITASSGFRRWRWIAAGASVALVAALALAAWRLSQPPSSSTSIAVQQISAPTGDGAAQVFADRLAGNLAILAAARPNSLKITQLAAGGPSPASEFIIGGEARTVGDAISATVNLSSVRDQSIVWSASFSRPVTEGSDLPDQAASRLADVLTCAFHGGEPAYNDIEVLKLFLTACATVSVGRDTLERVRADQLRKVVARAPNFARAWGELAIADAYLLVANDTSGNSLADDQRTVEDDASHALRLDPREARAWAARAVATLPVRDWVKRRAYLDRALALDPDQSAALLDRTVALDDVGRANDALVNQRRAADLDPLSAMQAANLAFKEALAGSVTESTATFAAAERRWPGDRQLGRFHLYAGAYMGDAAAALKALDDPAHPIALDPVDRQYLYLLCEARLNPARSAEASTFMRAHAGKDLTLPIAIEGLATLGRIDDAFEVAEANLSSLRNQKDVTGVFFRPFMAKFLADPRFMPLAARLGLVDVWRVTGLWPDYCSASGAPYDCRAEAAKALNRVS
jgi:hypothetical protein